MALNTDILQELINTGSDAQSNLFYVTLTGDTTEGESLEKYSARIIDFYAPEIKTSTAAIPYLGVKYILPTPSTPISKQITFTFRLDDNYELYEKLKEMSAVDQNGEITANTDKTVTITDPANWIISVEAYKASSSYIADTNNLESVYNWKFYDCIVTDIPAMNYSFNSAKPLEIKVTFIYSHYDASVPTTSTESLTTPTLA